MGSYTGTTPIVPEWVSAAPGGGPCPGGSILAAPAGDAARGTRRIVE